MSRPSFVGGLLAVVLYAFALLSIGLTRDWKLLHEDNGAIHTTFALSHLRLGLAGTRAHDLFFDPRTGQSAIYGHHPPAMALALAGAFALTGSDSVAVARLVPIFFHLGSLVLFAMLLHRLFSPRWALFGAFLAATLPMSSYFGRVVNYEPLCLFAVLIQLSGWARFRQSGSRAALGWLAFGVVLGGLIDWPAFFFAGAIAIAEAIDLARNRHRPVAPLLVVVVSASVVLLFDLWHLWYAGHGSLAAFRDVLARELPGGAKGVSFPRFASTQFETFRRYFTHAGLLSSIAVAAALARPRGRLFRVLLAVPDPETTTRLLAASGGAALGYVLAAPWWSSTHAYWQFHFLPFVVVSMILVCRFLAKEASPGQRLGARVLLALYLVEVVVTSGYVLRIRHRKVGAFAVQKTLEYRAKYLVPKSLEPTSETGPAPPP